jgi:hypothetical protein
MLPPGRLRTGNTYNPTLRHRPPPHQPKPVRPATTIPKTQSMERGLTDTTWLTATLLIDQTNRRSLALADRLAFKRYEDPADSRYWKRSVTPQTWRDSPLGGI